MSGVEILTHVSDDLLTCRIETPAGAVVELSGSPEQLEPDVLWPDDLARNRALVTNAWAHATLRHLAVTLPSVEEQEQADKQSQRNLRTAQWLAGLVDRPSGEEREAWCSGCFTLTEHRRLKGLGARSPIWMCGGCGGPSVPCAAPRCVNMAIRLPGRARGPRYCAEHRHDIPGFEKASKKIDYLSEYRQFLHYDKPNFARGTKIAGGGAVAAGLIGPLAFVAAPAIGGAVGALMGYSGVVATNAGLALLGGGSLAMGGLGMAGGTLVVTAVGAALGGSLGAGVMNTYLSEDKSFHIEMLRGGGGVPLVVANGFLTEGSHGWAQWRELVDTRYPDSPVYRVHWGAKELKNLGAYVTSGGGKGATAAKVAGLASRALKVAPKKMGPGASALAAFELARNPWQMAKVRSEKTGVILADLLARTREDSYVLIGHSLGARAMLVAAEALSTSEDAPSLEAVHLLGAAVGAGREWGTDFVSDGTLYNYHSNRDGVLKYAYKTAEAGRSAAGWGGFGEALPNVEDVNVSDVVGGHSEYFGAVRLR